MLFTLIVIIVHTKKQYEKNLSFIMFHFIHNFQQFTILQYLKKGRTAYYVTTEVKEGKTLKDTMCIADVVDKGDHLMHKRRCFRRAL